MESVLKDEYIMELLAGAEPMAAACDRLKKERDEALEWALHLENNMATWKEVVEGPYPLRETHCEQCGAFFDKGVECRDCSIVDAMCKSCCPFKLTHEHEPNRKRTRLNH